MACVNRMVTAVEIRREMLVSGKQVLGMSTPVGGMKRDQWVTSRSAREHGWTLHRSGCVWNVAIMHWMLWERNGGQPSDGLMLTQALVCCQVRLEHLENPRLTCAREMLLSTLRSCRFRSRLPSGVFTYLGYAKCTTRSQLRFTCPLGWSSFVCYFRTPSVHLSSDSILPKQHSRRHTEHDDFSAVWVLFDRHVEDRA